MRSGSHTRPRNPRRVEKGKNPPGHMVTNRPSPPGPVGPQAAGLRGTKLRAARVSIAPQAGHAGAGLHAAARGARGASNTCAHLCKGSPDAALPGPPPATWAARNLVPTAASARTYSLFLGSVSGGWTWSVALYGARRWRRNGGDSSIGCMLATCIVRGALNG
jgi:hypothetical protein